IVNRSMRLGILIQTIMQTTVTLTAFAFGLWWHLDRALPDGVNPIIALIQHNWHGVDIQTAETMAFVTLSMCELFRAFTVRSERLSIFQLGFFSNRYLVGAVALSMT